MDTYLRNGFLLNYLDVVEEKDFISGVDLAQYVGLDDAKIFNYPTHWLKFTVNDRDHFIAKKPIAYLISWDQLHQLGCVYDSFSSHSIHIKEKEYRITLLKGLNINYINKHYVQEDHYKYSEWNELMHRAYHFLNRDLNQLGMKEKEGYLTLCQENHSNLREVVVRGGETIESIDFLDKTIKLIASGWRPILREIKGEY